MSDLELAYTPAAEVARMIRDREVSPVEVVNNALERIDEVNPVLNCFCFTYPEEALEKARVAERAVSAGGDLGALHGVPVAIKDFTPTKGKTTTLGSRLYRDWVPDWDPVIVRRLEAAGAIMLGKTTTPEFAHSSFTESPLWGVTRNPWNRERTPGGSSGGSAGAVATGCVALAEGTDMGGSVRIPAALSGIVGLKPSLGRIPMDIVKTVYDSISHFGPLARTVEDAALFLDVVQGPDNRDIQSLPRCDIPRPLSGDVANLRLALSIDLGFYAVDPEVEANTRAAAGALVGAGATLEEIDLGWRRQINDAWYAYWGVFLAACFGDHFEAQRAEMDDEVVRLIEAGLAMDAVAFKKLEFVRTEHWLKLAAVLDDFDALLCPTMALPAPEIGGADSLYEGEDEEGRYHGLDMTCGFNFTAQCPAFSVPSGFTAAGLPTGLQIVGRRFDDPGVLNIGAALQKARPWTARRPEI